MANSLKEILQSMQIKEVEILRGAVVTVSPLKVQIDNDEKLTLSENSICVPEHLTDRKVKVDIELGDGSVTSATSTADEHTHTLASFKLTGASLKLYDALKADDRVILLSFNRGKRYYIIDRE